MMEGRNVSPSHTWRFIITLGDLFYGMGKRLQLILDKHKLWIYNGKVLKDPSVIRHPLEPAVIETEDESKERPLPFYECTITDGPRGPLLDKNVIGRRILNVAMNDGIYIKLTAFCFQVAGECFNKKILSDMTHRKDLLAELKKLEK